MDFDTEDYSANLLSSSQTETQSSHYDSSDSDFEIDTSEDESEPDIENNFDEISSFLDEPKVIVCLSQLSALFMICPLPECCSAIDPENRKIVQKGSVIKIKYICNSHHRGEWCNSPYFGPKKSKVWALNTVLATYSLTNGLHISQVHCK